METALVEVHVSDRLVKEERLDMDSVIEMTMFESEEPMGESENVVQDKEELHL
jgi:hypothetical protein